MVGKQIQHYRIIAELGEGGMGKVFKAFDTKLERFVAIKFLSPHLLKDELFLERFRTEGKNHAKLSHPNIVMVYGFIEYNDLIGLIIEYVEGVTIENLIERYKRLNLIYSLKIIRQVLIALEYAHSKGLIHRDIKPSNIIIDNNGVAKLMDFGISKSLNSKTDLTRMGRNVGTILYMSPEQINNQQSTAKTDLYSLAVTLYEMLSGNPPYLFDNEFKIYEAHLKSIPQKLSLKFADIPSEIDELILSAMNKSNMVNFSTAFEFRRAVEDLIFSLPVKINQITSTPQEIKTEKKKFGRGILIPTFLIITILAIAGLSYLFVSSYLPREEEKPVEKAFNFNSLKSNIKSDWQKVELNTNSNLTDILITKDKIYLTDDAGQVYVNQNDTLFQVISNPTSKGINRIIASDGKIFLFTYEGKIIVVDENFNQIKSIDISNESILNADLFKGEIVFCGGNGLLGKIDVNNLDYYLFKNIQPTDFFDVKFINENNIIAVGLDGVIVQSNDGGRNWTRKKLTTNYLKKVVVHPNKNLILTSGGAGTIFSSQDEGKTWTETKLNVTSPVNDFLFFDLNNFYAVNSTGDLITTTDGGNSWNVQKIEFYQPLNKITTDGKNLFIAGNNGLFLRKSL